MAKKEMTIADIKAFCEKIIDECKRKRLVLIVVNRRKVMNMRVVQEIMYFHFYEDLYRKLLNALTVGVMSDFNFIIKEVKDKTSKTIFDHSIERSTIPEIKVDHYQELLYSSYLLAQENLYDFLENLVIIKGDENG